MFNTSNCHDHSNMGCTLMCSSSNWYGNSVVNKQVMPRRSDFRRYRCFKADMISIFLVCRFSCKKSSTRKVTCQSDPFLPIFIYTKKRILLLLLCQLWRRINVLASDNSPSKRIWIACIPCGLYLSWNNVVIISTHIIHVICLVCGT